MTARFRGSFSVIEPLLRFAESLDEVEEVAALAVKWGAILLQLHPFERAGRAATLVGVSPLSADERLVAYVLAAHLQARWGSQLLIQLDLVHRDTAHAHGALIHAAPMREALELRQMVLQDNGLLLPLAYGIDPRWAIADLRTQRLAARWDEFMDVGWPALRRRTRRAAIDVARGRHGEVVAWHDLLRRYASDGQSLDVHEQKQVRTVVA